jgi:hypothetical protein
MSSEPQSLKATLDDLHRQLGSIESLDPEQRERLGSTLSEIQAALDGAKLHKQESMMRRLGEMVAQFERSHPALAASMNSLINTLANSGI